jgi:hypothetical protein
LFKSTDGAEKWLASNSGIVNTIGVANDSVEVVAIDPQDSDRLFAGTIGVTSEEGGVFKSSDGGENWARVAGGLPKGAFHTIVIDPTDPAVLYAGNYGSGVYKSLDGGETWKRMSSTGLSNKYILLVAIDPFEPNRLYALNLDFGLLIIEQK